MTTCSIQLLNSSGERSPIAPGADLTMKEIARAIRRPNIELLLDAVESTEKAAVMRASSGEIIEPNVINTNGTTDSGDQPSSHHHRRNIDMLLDAVESTKMAADAESKVSHSSIEMISSLEEVVDNGQLVSEEELMNSRLTTTAIKNGFSSTDYSMSINENENNVVVETVIDYRHDADCSPSKLPVIGTIVDVTTSFPVMAVVDNQLVVRKARRRKRLTGVTLGVAAAPAKKLKPNPPKPKVRNKKQHPRRQQQQSDEERLCTEIVVPVDPQSLRRSSISCESLVSEHDDCKNLLDVDVPIPFRSVGSKWAAHSEEAINFALSHNLIKKFRDCPKCGKQVALSVKTLTFRCSRQLQPLENGRKVRCEWYQSAKSGTWFEKTCMSLQGVLHITFLWLMMKRPRQAFVMDQLQCSTKTVVDWASYCREVCVFYVESESQTLGGYGRTVEMYEPKIVNRRRRGTQILDGTWIFGGFERESGKLFVVPVPKRDREALLVVVKMWIKPDTIIVSDCWRSYKCLGDAAYQALSDSQGYKFVEPEHSDEHAERVEQVWREVRCSIPRSGPCHLQLLGCLSEFIFKRKFSDSESRTLNFFHTVTKMYPGK